MRYLWLSLLFNVIFISPLQAELTITPSDVYRQAERIRQETLLIKKHFQITQTITFEPFRAELKPMHVWQKTYLIFIKLNILRKKYHYPALTPSMLEPVINFEPILPYEQTLRILTELDILKQQFGIEEKAPLPELELGKKPIDVFNKLHTVSLELDLLIHEQINPNYLFSEIMRIFEDVSMILEKLNIQDNTFPPSKVLDVKPQQSLDATFELMKRLQRLQQRAMIPITDFSPFYKKENATPTDVFNMASLCLAEFQTLKAYIGVKQPTHPAIEYEGKTPADAYQLLRWSIRMVSLIDDLR